MVKTDHRSFDPIWICSLRKVLDNVKLSSNVNIQKILMSGSRDMDKNPKKYPQLMLTLQSNNLG